MICILKTHTTKLEFKRTGLHRPKVSNTSYKAQSSWKRQWACLDAVLSQAAAARQQSRAQANEIERLDVLSAPGSFPWMAGSEANNPI